MVQNSVLLKESLIQNDATVLLIMVKQDDRERIASRLNEASYEVITAEDINTGLRNLYRYSPDVVIVAIDGPHAWKGMQRIRELSHIPMILVSSQASRDSLQRAFDMGVDGYLTRPVNAEQLLGRLASILSRKARNNHNASSSVFRHENLTIDWKRFEVRVGERAVHLSPTEFKLLSFLVERRGHVVTYDQILTHVWGSIT